MVYTVGEPDLVQRWACSFECVAGCYYSIACCGSHLPSLWTHDQILQVMHHVCSAVVEYSPDHDSGDGLDNEVRSQEKA